MGTRTVTAGVLGAAGYLGGELLRLLGGHPRVQVTHAVSTRFPGRRVDTVHPNLRGHTDLTFCTADDLGPCDVLLLATPHTTTMKLLPEPGRAAGHRPVRGLPPARPRRL